jgi:uncharacterized protein YbjT (DUF2867 family)
MNTTEKTILVTGATGQQGGASVRHLQAGGWHLRALTRDPHTPAASALADTGVEVVQGDLNDRASLDQALKGAYGVYSVQTYLPHDPSREVFQGKTLAEAAKAANIAHFVYSSAAGADQHTGVPEQESKYAIEQSIHSLDLPATILRPTFLMENFQIPALRQSILAGSLYFGMPAQTKIQFIAGDDVGAFVALAFEQPGTFLGKALELAGDEMPMQQVAETFSRVMGRALRYIEMPIDQVRSFDPNLALLSEWIIREGFHADITALCALYPALMTLETWMRQTGWEQATE